MADEANASVGPQQTSSAAGNDGGPGTITLKIIQPSLPIPLVYKDLSVESTVRELKEKLRGDVAVGDSQLRLIYRGRLMDRDEATLLQALGEAAIRESTELALHLILHPRPGAVPTANSTSAQRPSSRPSSQPPPVNRPPAPGNMTPQMQAHMQAHALAQAQQRHAQHVRNIQREAMLRQQAEHMHMSQAAFRQQIGQNQRDRASAGLHGIQDDLASQQGASGRNSPVPGQSQRTFVREHIGPDGQNWRVTVTESTTVTNAPPMVGTPNTSHPAVPAGGSLSPFDVQNVFRNADASQAIQAWNNALNRNTPGPSGPSVAGAPGVGGSMGTPVQGLSRAGSRTATPEPGRQAFAGPIPRVQSGTAGPEVYILMSPTGPRALLMHNTHGTYITPGARPPNVQVPLMPFPQGQLPLPHLPFPAPARIPLPPTPPVVRPPTVPPVADGQDIVQQWLRPPQQQPAAAPAAPDAQQPNAAGQQNQAAPAGAQPVRPLHPNNPAAAAGVAANIGQYVWLVIRIGLLIWWFTGPNTSWTRWFTMIGLGLAILIISSGVLDGPANHVWQPIRRHIEGLLPRGLPANPPNRPPAAVAVPDGADPAAAALRAPGDPDPREIAARLIAERQAQDRNWVMTQVRRVERAGILFLASIVPGLAEGHVAMFEAEARAERRRAEEAAAAAAREAEEAAAAAAAEDGPGEGAGEADNEAQPIPESQPADGVPEASSSAVESQDGVRRRIFAPGEAET